MAIWTGFNSRNKLNVSGPVGIAQLKPSNMGETTNNPTRSDHNSGLKTYGCTYSKSKNASSVIKCLIFLWQVKHYLYHHNFGPTSSKHHHMVHTWIIVWSKYWALCWTHTSRMRRVSCSSKHYDSPTRPSPPKRWSPQDDKGWYLN